MELQRSFLVKLAKAMEVAHEKNRGICKKETVKQVVLQNRGRIKLTAVKSGG